MENVTVSVDIELGSGRVVTVGDAGDTEDYILSLSLNGSMQFFFSEEDAHTFLTVVSRLIEGNLFVPDDKVKGK